jgi:hypothetical protein
MDFGPWSIHGFYLFQWLRAKESVEKYTLAVDAYRECKDDIEQGNLN